MRIIQQGTVYKIQEQKFNLCSREPYWKTLKHKVGSEQGESEYDYEFESREEAEDFINKHYRNYPAGNMPGLKL